MRGRFGQNQACRSPRSCAVNIRDSEPGSSSANTMSLIQDCHKEINELEEALAYWYESRQDSASPPEREAPDRHASRRSVRPSCRNRRSGTNEASGALFGAAQDPDHKARQGISGRHRADVQATAGGVGQRRDAVIWYTRWIFRPIHTRCCARWNALIAERRDDRHRRSILSACGCGACSVAGGSHPSRCGHFPLSAPERLADADGVWYRTHGCHRSGRPRSPRSGRSMLPERLGAPRVADAGWNLRGACGSARLAGDAGASALVAPACSA